MESEIRIGAFSEVGAYKNASTSASSTNATVNTHTQKTNPCAVQKLRAEGSGASAHTPPQNKAIRCAQLIEQNPWEAQHSTIHATEVSNRTATSSFQNHEHCLPADAFHWSLQHSALQPVANCEDAKLQCGIQTPPSYGLVTVAGRMNVTCF